MLSLFPINFSPSMMEDVWKCELYFFRKHCLKLVGANIKKNPDLLAGGHFSKACEITRIAYFNDKWNEEDAIEKGFEYIIRAEDTGDTDKTNEVIARSFKKYWKKFPLASDLIPCELEDGTFAVEYDFTLDLGIPHPDIEGMNVCLRGKLDGLYTKQHFGNNVDIYVVDEKTTGRLKRVNGTGSSVDSEGEKVNYRTSGQFLAYHLAARKVLGVKTTATLVRKVPLLKNHEDAFELRVEVTDWQIQQWFNTTISKIQELIEKYKYWKQSQDNPQSAFYPIYSSGCTSFNRRCEFMEGCESEDGEELMLSTFMQKAWDSDKKELISLNDYINKVKGI